METHEVVELAFAIVAALGVAGGFAVWILKLVANTIATQFVEKFKSELQREVESYRTKLKKSEFLFQKQYEAASEFTAMKRRFLPPYRFPDMIWDDACEDIAQDFERIEKDLGKFIAKHGAIMSKEVLNALSRSEGIAAEHKFKASYPEPSDEAVAAARELWDQIIEIEEKLREVVLSQSST